MDIDAAYYDSIDLLKRLIAVPSFSREENAAADLLENYFAELKLSPRRKGNNIYLFSQKWADSKPVILLNSHIDTVRPTNGWTRQPFLPSEEEGKLYGLGSNDAGASLVALFQTFMALNELDEDNNFIFLASAEEEISGANGIESVLPDLPEIALGIVGEPTEMQPAVAEKGLMVLDGIVRGKSGHAARNEGENAIYKAIPVIEWFRSKQFPKISPLLGAVKMTVTQIEAGRLHNVVPDELRFTVDVRPNEFYGNAELLEEISASCGCEIIARSVRLNSSSIAENHPLVERALMLGLQPFGSPTLSDRALMRFPALKIGPGASSRSHSADEFVFTSEIREAIDIYIRLLKGLKISYGKSSPFGLSGTNKTSLPPNLI
ncbi:MAG: M20 family metallo-hydrolase [Dysgonamonadaceae bacterium]|jgi:acetylornithine deacetylase|nr:M20 family metallo-hydrolase [Dysgonamonadaceae bacterium]